MAIKRTVFFGSLFLSVFFYAWQMKSVHGLIPGIHLTLLVLGFFFLCSPLAAVLVSINQMLNGSVDSNGNQSHLCENILLILNLSLALLCFVSIKQLPGIFNSSGITFLFYQLMQSEVIYQFLALSQGSFLGQFFISKTSSRAIRLWLSLLLTLIACVLFYAMIPMIQEVVVVGINSRVDNF